VDRAEGALGGEQARYLAEQARGVVGADRLEDGEEGAPDDVAVGVLVGRAPVVLVAVRNRLGGVGRRIEQLADVEPLKRSKPEP